MNRVWLVMLLATTLTGCTQASTPDPPVPSRTTEEAAAASPSPLVRLRADWVREVNDGCLIGLKMYPSLALGVDADVDTVDLGVNKFAASLSQVRPADDPAAREEAQALITKAGPLKIEWKALARATSVSSAQRQKAVQHARTFILAVAAIGAPACGDLAPPPA